jgi:virginiamycin B lyase
LWFTETNASKIGKITPQLVPTITEYPTLSANVAPTTIIGGADGALWFAESRPVKLGRMTVAGVATNEFALTPAGAITGIVLGIDGNYYFGDPVNNKVALYNPSATKTPVMEFPIPTANSGISQMGIGPDQRIYFAETKADKIGQFEYF